jgi:hypothetical protein
MRSLKRCTIVTCKIQTEAHSYDNSPVRNDFAGHGPLALVPQRVCPECRNRPPAGADAKDRQSHSAPYFGISKEMVMLVSPHY